MKPPGNIGARTPRIYPLPRIHGLTHVTLMEATRMNRVYAAAAMRGEILLTLIEADRLAVWHYTHLDAMWPELAEATPHLCQECGDEPVRPQTRYCSINHQNRATNRRRYEARKASRDTAA